MVQQFQFPVGTARFLGSRFSASPYRQAIDEILESGDSIELDLTGLNVTQSFVDELLGLLLVRHGPTLLERMSFRGCSEDTRAIIRFVVSHRLADWNHKYILNR